MTELDFEGSRQELADELHWTGIPLRSIPASELCRYVAKAGAWQILRRGFTAPHWLDHNCENSN